MEGGKAFVILELSAERTCLILGTVQSPSPTPFLVFHWQEIVIQRGGLVIHFPEAGS